MSEKLVTVENLSKKFCRDLRTSLWYGVKDIANELLGQDRTAHSSLRKKEFWAVQDVNFELKRGECLGLIGHNGAGKSTLLKMLNGLIKPDMGMIKIKGRVGALIELGAGFNPILTGRENIYVNGSVLGFSKFEINQKLDEIITFAEIGDFMDTPVQYYSSGMKVRLGFAIAAQMEPDVLIVDEVLAVGDAGFRAKCLNKISEISKNAVVIFVSHQMPQISRISDFVLLLNRGKTQFLGNNLNEGIQLYYDGFINNQDKKYFGDKLDICHFEIQDSSAAFRYEETISLNAILRSFEYTGVVYILLTIVDQSGRGVASILSDKNQITKNSETKISLSFQNQFSQGVFSISVTIFSLDKNRRDILLKYHNIASFRSAGDFLTIGEIPIGIKGVWSIK